MELVAQVPGAVDVTVAVMVEAEPAMVMVETTVDAERVEVIVLTAPEAVTTLVTVVPGAVEMLVTVVPGAVKVTGLVTVAVLGGMTGPTGVDEQVLTVDQLVTV